MSMYRHLPGPLLVLGAALACPPQAPAHVPATPDDVAGLDVATAVNAARFHDAHGVRLVFGRRTHHEGRFRVHPVDPTQAPRALALAWELTATYPAGFLDALVDEIRFVGAADTPDGAWGGVTRCRERRIVVAVSDRTTDDGVLRALHHEVGHAVHCALDLDEAAWTARNDRPYASSVASWRDGMRLRASHQVIGDTPFATTYAEASLYEDVAETFALAMTQPDAVARRRALAGKAAMLESLVRQAHPEFAFPR